MHFPESGPVFKWATSSRRLQNVVSKAKRVLELGLLTLLLSLSLISKNSQLAYGTSTIFANDYPYQAAKEYDRANYDWWIDENNNGKADVTPDKNDNDEAMSPYGYSYRNCTDGVAYWAKKYLNADVNGWENAKDWNEAAVDQKITVKLGNTADIEPGDIAQSDDGDYGHVGLVVAVSKNAQGQTAAIKVAELNKKSGGEFSEEPLYSAKNAAGHFVRGGNRDWDHFIDLNGAGKGLYGEDLDGEDKPGIVSYAHKNVTVTSNILGGLSIFTVNETNLLSYKDQTYAGEDLNAKLWGSIHATLMSTPEIAHYPNGALSMFAQSTDDKLHHAWQSSPGSSWSRQISPWNVRLRGEPMTVFNYTGGISVFFSDSNGSMRQIDQLGGGGDIGSAAVHNLGGDLQGKPAVINVGGAIAVFAHAADGQLKTNYQRSAGGAWSGWENLGQGQRIKGDPKVVMNRLGGMTVLAIGERDDIVGIDQAYRGESMNKPFYSLSKPAGVNFNGTPGIVQTNNGEQMVFAVATNGPVYHKAQVHTNYYNWTDFFPLSGNLAGAPTIIHNSMGGASIFGRNPDGTVVTLDQPGYGTAFNPRGWIGLAKP